MNLRNIVATALLLSVPLAAQAFTPESGWYIPVTQDNASGKGGTGIAIEFQNEYMFAAGFIYGVNGLPIWVAMEGTLKKQADGSWGLTDNGGLYTAQNGQCLGSLSACPYKSPSEVLIGGFSINFPTDNIGTLVWGINGNQASVTLERFVYNLGNGPQSMLGRWDILIEHQPGSNADSIQFDGDRIRINDVHTNADGSYAINGCVENSNLASSQACAPNTANVFGVTGTAKSTLFGHSFQMATYGAPSGGSAKLYRVYTFTENGIGGGFTGTIKGTVNLCGGGVSTADQCTTVKNVKFTAYRSASGNFAKGGNGMDQTPVD